MWPGTSSMTSGLVSEPARPDGLFSIADGSMRALSSPFAGTQHSGQGPVNKEMYQSRSESRHFARRRPRIARSQTLIVRALTARRSGSTVS